MKNNLEGEFSKTIVFGLNRVNMFSGEGRVTEGY